MTHKRPLVLAGGEQAEQGAVPINLGRLARTRKARLHWRVAIVNAPLPARRLQLDHLDFKQGFPFHPSSMQCGR